MAPWPYSIPSYLRTDLLHPYIFSVLTVTTLTEARSQTNSSSFTDLPEHDPIFSFEYFQRSFFIVLGHVSNLARQRNVRKLAGQIGLWDIGFFVMACGLMQSIRIWKKRRQTQREGSVLSNCSIAGSRHGRENIRASLDDDGKSRKDAESTDPGLLKKYSSFKSYTTSTGTYPSIRTFYRPHSQADKLPSKPTPLPLLVFIHGLGGSLAQFHPLLTSLINAAPCFGIDLPGCGLSKFSPTSWDHYTLPALAELIDVAIQDHCQGKENQGVVLIGHSMGCSLAALLASVTSPVQFEPRVEVLAMIAVCPKASLPSDRQISTYKKLLKIPTPIFNLWRRWDRRGGSESPSVARFVGPNADIGAKKLQERFNTQSQTAVWRRMAWGTLPYKSGDNMIRGGLPGLDVWAGLLIPLFLVAGEADHITPASEIAIIRGALSKTGKSSPETSVDQPLVSNSMKDSNGDLDERLSPQSSTQKQAVRDLTTEITVIEDSNLSSMAVSDRSSGFSKKRRVLKTSVLPAPASHALLYDPATYRTLAGLIQTFLSDHVDSRLSLGWQLQHLCTEGKWDVKNLVKWQTVRPVSDPIAGIFRAMKTLREVDQSHSPEIFVRDWKGKIKAVVDISHESPVYDPKGLDDRGIEYHKFPTVSKIPPTPEEVESFNALVDQLRWKTAPSGAEEALIGVHCHYGFNRTGFFICCYLIEKERFGIQQAIDEFRARRPPGIRHEHFLDTLFVRYCIGLKRAPTF